MTTNFNPSTNNLWLLIAVSFMALIINVDYTAVNLALVPMASDLNATIDGIKWALSGYVLAWAALVIPAGKTLDIYGPRRICIFGLALFLVGSLVTGLATSEATLIAGRVIQGVAGAFYVPTLYGLISIYFPPEKRGLAIGILSLGVGLGMAIGPTFGGLMVALLNWRWIFLINLPLGLFVMGILLLSSEKSTINKQQSIDKSAAFLLMLAIVSMIYALNNVVDWGILSIPFLALSAFSIATLIGFIRRQKKSPSPLISGALMKNRNYMGATIGLALEQYAFAALVVIISLFLKTVGISALYAGIFFLALTLVFAIVSPITGKLIDSFGVKPFALSGMIILALTTLWLAYLPAQVSVWHIIFVLLVMGLGMGIAFSALNTGVVTSVSETETGMASSVFLMLALLANTCGVIISTLIYEWVSYSALVAYASQYASMPLSVLQLDQLHHLIVLIGNSTPQLDSFTEVTQISIMKILPTALAHGMHVALIISAIVTLAGGCFIGLLIKNPKQQGFRDVDQSSGALQPLSMVASIEEEI